MRTTAVAVALLTCALCVGAPLDAVWERERRGPDGWAAEGGQFTADDEGMLTVTRGAPHHARISATVTADLAATPWLRMEVGGANAQWRLTARAGDGPELVVLDRQVVGTGRRNLATLLGVEGETAVSLHMHIWGWGGGAGHYVRFRPSLVTEGPDSDARELLGDMAGMDRRSAGRAERLGLRVPGHPRLRFNAGNLERRRALAAQHPELAEPLSAILAELDQRKAEEPYVFTAETYRTRRPAWGQNLLSVRPPTPPELRPGEGADPFPGMTVETAWRQLYWHNFSHWLLGAALTDDPAFVEQARRWAVTLTDWRLGLQPDYIYFDFGTSYPLQALSLAYDITAQVMTTAERDRVREAIATLAHGLYLNTLSGHGSIYNDLRGNHTSVTMCGLGMAGCVLMGEDERAPLWIALAERFMLDSFEEHTCGGWLESPSYGAYGVSEWVRLAEVIRNVTGHNHLRHPFLHRFAEFQLHVADWEGRDLGYNHGGTGQYWNQWVFHAIAREFQDPRFQWLGRPTEDARAGAGYGDRFWWVDPALPAERPTETDTGRHFEDIGVSVWRSGWDEQATILLHHCGMKGQHKERNMNHVTLYALGERILPDGVGTGTEDHNVPVIDDLIQNLWMPGETLAYHCDPRSGYALGDTRLAYHGTRRHVLFLRPDVVVLVDEIALGDRGDRTVRFLLHPNGECTAEDGVLTVRSGDVALQAVTVLADGTSLPMTASEREDQRRATHDAWATFVGQGDLRAFTFLLISPVPGPPAPQVEANDRGLRLLWGDAEVMLGLAPGEIAPGLSTTADLWLARLRGGEAEAVLVPGSHDMGATRTELVTPVGTVSGSPSVSWGRE